MTHTAAGSASDSAPDWSDQDTDGLPHVLIVDDEDAVRRYIARILQQDGLVVHQANDGAEALELIKRGTEPVELVVSDIVMPRLNGVDLLNALAASHPDVSVILMSAYAQRELSEMGVVPPCGVLPKPFAAHRLIAEVRRCLSKRQ